MHIGELRTCPSKANTANRANMGKTKYRLSLKTISSSHPASGIQSTYGQLRLTGALAAAFAAAVTFVAHVSWLCTFVTRDR